ncbi:hypothetical protein NDU88_004480 [Pleurodeles waltl]|uniref:Uncharacterized protein n=1 Tax=Pleurodeles waltl TaxID=8319 RepID=A0AAV7N1J3_PLEWA|nr:hypothetical protein NDU88_004480 [Pleurodeles waltl]
MWAGILCLSIQVGPLSDEAGEETAATCQMPEKHCGNIAPGPLSSLLPSRWALWLRAPVEQKLRPGEVREPRWGRSTSPGRLHRSRGLQCVRLSELGTATAGPTSAPTPPARGRPSVERPVSGHSGVWPPQHQGTAGQAQIKGCRPIRAVRPYLLWIPMRGSRWHSSGARTQDPAVSSHLAGPDRDRRGLSPIRPNGPLSPPVRRLRPQGPGPDDSLSPRGGGGTHSSQGSAPPSSRSPASQLLRGRGRRTPLTPLICAPPARPIEDSALLQGSRREDTAHATILVAGPGGSRWDSSLASLRSLAPRGPQRTRNIPGSTGRCFRVEIKSASSGG